MSALARYFHHSGYHVSGYDRTPSPLTHELEQEGIAVTYEDNYDQVKTSLKPRNNSLVIRTPAVPDDSVLLNYFREQGYDIRKRSEVLGLVTHSKKALCVAGTHGKTTTSTMLAYLLSGEQAANGEGNDGVNAFLGGISMNYVMDKPISAIQLENYYNLDEGSSYKSEMEYSLSGDEFNRIADLDFSKFDDKGTTAVFSKKADHRLMNVIDSLPQEFKIEASCNVDMSMKVITGADD